jgi:hypothetical protein
MKSILEGGVCTPILANEFLEAELETQVSHGYLRGLKHGRFKTYSG